MGKPMKPRLSVPRRRQQMWLSVVTHEIRVGVYHVSTLPGWRAMTSFAPTGTCRCYRPGPTAYAVG